MSVRRLAEIQPDSFAFTAESRAWVDKQIAKYPPGRQASAVIPLLWQAQKQNGYWLPKPAIEEVGRILEMPYIRVLEIATFYTMFNLAPVGQFYIQMCGTTPCMLAGSDEIKSVLEARIGSQGKITPDGKFSWLEVECLGACCNAPMVQINDDYYEDLTAENFTTLLDNLEASRPVTVGSQTGRHSSEPGGGLTSLTTLYGMERNGSAPVASGSGPGSSPADEKASQDARPDATARDRAFQEREESRAKPQDSIEKAAREYTPVDIATEGKAADLAARANAEPVRPGTGDMAGGGAPGTGTGSASAIGSHPAPEQANEGPMEPPTESVASAAKQIRDKPAVKGSDMP